MAKDGIKTLFSQDDKLGRLYILGYAENIVAEDCKWEEAGFSGKWFPRTPKLADQIAIVYNYQGYYNLYWREKDEGENFYQALNDMALQNGYECITEPLPFKTDDLKRERYKYTVKNVEKQYSGWGEMNIKLTIEWNSTESDKEYNISASYYTEFSKNVN